jgi:hypothetical protein
MRIIENGIARDITSEEFDEIIAVQSAVIVRENDVISERKRRLALGFDFNFQDARGIHHIGTTDQDMEGWDEVTKLAQVALNVGQSNYVINIKTNTGAVAVTAAEWQQILLAAGTFRQPIFAASFAIQSMSPIPADFAANSRWP